MSRIPTNQFLFRTGLVPSQLCSFCNAENENLIHSFWDYDITKIFWEELTRIIEHQGLESGTCSKPQCLGLGQ